MARGPVVITGASSGIGRAAAGHLSDLGFDVFAGVRSDEDAERLRAAGLRPLRIDVTDAGSIATAREEVEAAAGGALAGLVNNAGVAVTAPVEVMPVEALRRQLEINVVGQAAVTQALLPLLRAGRGRIVNVSSIGGRVALPLMGAYAASKFALEALSDSLRRELRGQGMRVVVIEPGGVKTPIWDKGAEEADRLVAGASPEARERYGSLERALRAEAQKIATERGLPPEAVAEVIGKALTARRPRTRYLVGGDAKSRALVARFLPDRALDGLIGRALRG
jgi:NAD(P)-dependent dehydrogenase (short-subunit alcohol dehydrogenase family)